MDQVQHKMGDYIDDAIDKSDSFRDLCMSIVFRVIRWAKRDLS